MMELFDVYFDERFNLIISVSWIIYCIVFIFLLIWIFQLIKRGLIFQSNVEFESAEIGIQGHKIKIKPNYTNIEIAYKIWVELNTRKIGLKIDFEHDVISEIYSSWYKFFGITRDLIKSLPASKIRKDKYTKELIGISTKILNEGLRPHLTEWCAKYLKWYHNESENKKDKSPQDIQKLYPDYDLLKEDMTKINDHLIKYKEVIYVLAFGDK
jgi:hypothetical protein